MGASRGRTRTVAAPTCTSVGSHPLRPTTSRRILDPGAPSWLLEGMTALLPEMFAMYTERFGRGLPWKPVVLFSFSDVEMSAVGHDWHEATPDAAEQLLYLVAHEAAHFWNGQLLTYDDMADSWMHEGSADAFASLALRRADYIDAVRATERLTRTSWRTPESRSNCWIAPWRSFDGKGRQLSYVTRR